MTAKTTGLYVIGRSNGPVKIGISTDPVQRLSELQTGAPSPISLFHFFDVGHYASFLERAAHIALRDRRTNREWFSVSAVEAREAIEMLATALNVDLCPFEPRDLDLIQRKASRGRHKDGPRKMSTTIRLDADVVAALRGMGRGW